MKAQKFSAINIWKGWKGRRTHTICCNPPAEPHMHRQLHHGNVTQPPDYPYPELMLPAWISLLGGAGTLRHIDIEFGEGVSKEDGLVRLASIIEWPGNNSM